MSMGEDILVLFTFLQRDSTIEDQFVGRAVFVDAEVAQTLELELVAHLGMLLDEWFDIGILYNDLALRIALALGGSLFVHKEGVVQTYLSLDSMLS